MKTGLDYHWNGHTLTYNEAGQDSSDSIPLGNGDIGVNLWVEESGDLVLLLTKSDAFSELNQLLKLGRLRFSFDSPSMPENPPVRLMLNTAGGVASIQIGTIELEVWVDAHAPKIMVGMKSDHGFEYAVKLESWRQFPRLINAESPSYWNFAECQGAVDLMNGPDRYITLPKDVFLDEQDALLWAHRNPAETVVDDDIRRTGCESFKELCYNPLAHRITGAYVSSPDLRRLDPFSLQSESLHASTVAITLHSAQTPSLDEWVDAIREQAREAVDYEGARTRHQAWWKERADRHHITVSGSAEAEHVSMCYALQRYMNLCAGRGLGPIHFNGSLFTVDWHVIHPNGISETYNADYRRWGNLNLVQNTRWAYWTMLHSGDFECMQPFFMWYKRLLPIAIEKCRTFYGHDGLITTECMSLWGATPTGHLHHLEDPAENYRTSWSFKYYSAVLEMLAIQFDYYDFSGDTAFLDRHLLPLWRAVVQFYLNHFEVDPAGKIMIEGTAIEQFHDCLNPMPDLAGLHMLCSRFLELSELSEGERGHTEALMMRLPPLPLCTVGTEYPTLQDRIEQVWKPLGVPLERPPKVGADSEPRLAPAAEVRSGGWNVENPELYAVFPFRQHCLAHGDVELARRSFLNRTFIHDWGWAQDPVQAAMVGLTDEARERVVRRYRKKFPAASFPVFWDAGFDWIPDQDNGGVANKALQSMLIQYHGKKILLFPAWPRQWDVKFKLYAPFRTVIEGELRDGRLVSIKVDPPEREADVQNVLVE